MQRIVILISGRGSNMQAIVRACAAERWDAQIAAVIATSADAPGLAWAAEQKIAVAAVDPQTCADREAFDAALALQVDACRPDLILLAGFMRILGPAFVGRYAGRMLNIHPSLLPAFTGLATHRRALQAGCQLTGATVHLVTPDLDQGPILIQGAVPVRAGDDEAALAARVLTLEHVIYPLAVRWWIEGRLRIEGNRVVHTDGEAQALMWPDA